MSVSRERDGEGAQPSVASLPAFVQRACNGLESETIASRVMIDIAGLSFEQTCMSGLVRFQAFHDGSFTFG